MATPLQDVVLVGGGHSHVQVLRSHAMRPLPGARVTVVVDRPVAVYSGMVPGLVAGDYAHGDVEIDVRPLARRAGCRVIIARATGLDPQRQRVLLEGRPPIRYDWCSVNVGATVAGTDLPGVREHALPTRPIGRFVRLVDAAVERVASLDRPARVVVVGAGAAGVELAFCLQQRVEAASGRRPVVSLVGASGRVLPGKPARAARAVEEAAADRGITVRTGARVRGLEAGVVVLESGERLAADLIPWVTGAASTGLFSDTLPTDGRGFVWVEDTLQVQGESKVFAVGDCAVLRSWPEIPKAGVYAVREGPVLTDNLRAALSARPLRTYAPQRDFLTLLHLGRGEALGLRNGLALRGRWVLRLKDWIDRRFMERFQVLAPDGAVADAFAQGMPEMDEGDMVCGGCAAKVGEQPLRRALARLGAPHDADVTLGLAQPDDVAVLRRPGEQLVTSIDAFPAFVDDPWLVGRVAADNALSDLHAKGVEPRLALALVSLPDDEEPEEALFQVLAGARDVLDAAGATLAGGHTTVGERLTVGFAVTGFAALDQRVLPKGGLRPGDSLVLTRPLGTGVLFAADMAGRAAGPWMEAAVAGLMAGNRAAGEIARAAGVSASTDVTGFGLVGHAGELARASGCSVVLELGALPALPGALALLARGERSTFHHQNRESLRGVRVEGQPAVSTACLELAVDPQTAGGLLLGVAPGDASALIEALREAGCAEACVVGEATAAGDVPVTLRWPSPG